MESRLKSHEDRDVQHQRDREAARQSLTWLAEAQPDAVCLQEIKCTNAVFPAKALDAAGYGAIWRGQGPNHGVAILAKNAEALEMRQALPGDPDDHEAHYIEAAIEHLLIGCLSAKRQSSD